MTTRQTLIEDMQGMETIILDLEGVTRARSCRTRRWCL